MDRTNDWYKDVEVEQVEDAQLLMNTSKKLAFESSAKDLRGVKALHTNQGLIDRICTLEREIALITARLDKLENKDSKKLRPTVE